MSEKANWSKIINLVLIGLPLAMGVVTVVVSIISTIQGTPQTDMSVPLGLGLACLALYNLDKESDSFS